MQRGWPQDVQAHLLAHHNVARIIIVAAKGSTPRGVGAAMIVTAQSQIGTIGGGAMEFQTIDSARHAFDKIPATGFMRFVETFALGPDLGQCCGGQVTVLFEVFAPSIADELLSISAEPDVMICHDIASQTLPQPITTTRHAPIFHKGAQRFIAPAAPILQPLYVYGAGHVGRALIPLLQGLRLDIIWVDTTPNRFPETVPDRVLTVPASDMAVIARNAPQRAFHLVLTYSHQFDEAICHALLVKGDFSRLGLIGSATKKARFAKRFAQAGIAQELIDQLQCPVGLTAIKDKAPAHVALSIAGQVAQWLEETDDHLELTDV